jgi:hypothetical protein
MKQDYDKKCRPSQDFQIGEKVMVEATHITTTRPSKKLDEKRVGPFKIVKKVGASSFKLDIPPKWKTIHPVFNEAILSRYVCRGTPIFHYSFPFHFLYLRVR